MTCPTCSTSQRHHRRRMSVSGETREQQSHGQPALSVIDSDPPCASGRYTGRQYHLAPVLPITLTPRLCLMIEKHQSLLILFAPVPHLIL
ncbi:MAG: hypothetical protein NVSMB22_18530 [Chloroflexota bacterium]